jgi:hypothetical protein
MTSALERVSCVLGLLLAGTAVAGDDQRWTFGIETGPVWQSRNDIQRPGNAGTRFGLDETVGTGPYPFLRLEAAYRLSDKHELRGLLAPFEIEESGTLRQSTLYDGQTFSAGPVGAKYRFNSYRLTWRYTLVDSDRAILKLGATGKIRDAEVALRQGGVQARDANVGFVPLVHAYGEYRLGERWRTIVDFDGLVGPGGRAIDVAFKLSYDVTKDLALEAGYRVLEGGVKSDDVYNLALFNYALVGLRFRH